MMTETVVTVENAPPNNNAAKPNDSSRSGSFIKFNPEYFKTQPGLLKIAQLVSQLKRKESLKTYGISS